MKKKRPIKITIITIPLFIFFLAFFFISLYTIVLANDRSGRIIGIFPTLVSSYLVTQTVKIYTHSFIAVTKDEIVISQIGILPVSDTWRTAGYHASLKKDVTEVSFNSIKFYSFEKNFSTNKNKFRVAFFKPICFFLQNEKQILWETAWYSKKQRSDILAIINKKCSLISYC